MTKTTCMLWLVAGLILTVAAPSRAQTPPPTQTPPPPTQTPPPTQVPPPVQTPPPAPKAPQTTSAFPTKNFFIDVNGGFQAASHSIAVTSTPLIYDEPAKISSTQKIGGGPLFDLSLGYRVWHDLAIAVGFSTTSSKSDAQVTASIPHPLFTDQPKTTTASISDLKHTERAVSVQAVWTSPINDKMDAAISFGPTFIKVIQNLVTNVNVPAGTQDATPVADQQSKTAVGFAIGGDVTYLINPRYGVGAMARYVIGKVDLPAASGLTVGGFQIGGGLRLRF